jgi:hypothetical protein
MKPWRRQLEVLMLSYVVAAALALCVNWNRWFFEPRVGEVYPSAAAGTLAVMESLARGDDGQDAVRKLTREDGLGLYDCWMQDPREILALPRALVILDEELFLARAERSFVTGSPEQKKRAVDFLAATGSSRTEAILERARSYSRRRQERELQEHVERTLGRLRSDPTRREAHVGQHR